MYAILQIPLFPMQALLRQMPLSSRGAVSSRAPFVVSSRSPLAVVDDSKEVSRVICVNQAAARLGVSEGMRPPQALARCADLTLLPRSASAEVAAERMALLLAQTLSPRVEATRPGLVTVDLRGTRESRTLERCEVLVERFRELGIRVPG